MQAPVFPPMNSLGASLPQRETELPVGSPAPSDLSAADQMPLSSPQQVKAEPLSTPSPPSSPPPEPTPRVLRSGLRPRSAVPFKRKGKQHARSLQLRSPPEEESATQQEDNMTAEPDHAGDGDYEATPPVAVPAGSMGSNDDEDEQMVISQVQPDTSAEASFSISLENVEEDGTRSDAQEEHSMDADHHDLSGSPRPPSSIGYSAADQDETRGTHDINEDEEMFFPSESIDADREDLHGRAGGQYRAEYGAETQVIIEDRRRALAAKRVSHASSGLGAEGTRASERLPRVFKGKAKVADRDIDFGDVGDRTPQPKTGSSRRVSPPPRVRPSDALRVSSYGNLSRVSITSTRRSRPSMGSPPPPSEDSDSHFNGLDAVMKKALRALCLKYRFSAMDVRQKFEQRHGDLTSTKKCLEDNRRILDEDSLFQDMAYTYD